MKIHKTALLVILLNFVLSLLNLHNYGVYWDEENSRMVGLMNYNFITGRDQALLSFTDRDYGPVIETVAYWLEMLLKPHSYEARVTIRHIFSLVIYNSGLLFFYFLLIECAIPIKAAVLGLIFFILSPRIYGHGYFNTKDIALMVGYIGVALTLLKLLKKQSIFNVVLHAFASAIFIDIRIVGVVSVPLTFVFLLLFVARGKIQWIKALSLGFGYIFITVLFVIMMWPFLWHQPFYHLLFAYENMQHFRFENPVLFNGTSVPAPELPSYYLPAWLCISITIPQIISGLVAIPFFIVFILRTSNKESALYIPAMFGILFFCIPFGVIIVRHSVVYDSWRHVFFIFPFLVLLSILLTWYLYQRYPKGKLIFNILIIVCLLQPAYSMIRNNPFHVVYFNAFANANTSGKPINQMYEMDYWGVYYKYALKEIALFDTRQNIPIYCNNSYPFELNKNMYNDEAGTEKFFYADSFSEADYYITTYRYEMNDLTAPYLKLIETLKYDRDVFISIYRIERNRKKKT